VLRPCAQLMVKNPSPSRTDRGFPASADGFFSRSVNTLLWFYWRVLSPRSYPRLQCQFSIIVGCSGLVRLPPSGSCNVLRGAGSPARQLRCHFPSCGFGLACVLDSFAAITTFHTTQPTSSLYWEKIFLKRHYSYWISTAHNASLAGTAHECQT
jgi:hypothetical protein